MKPHIQNAIPRSGFHAAKTKADHKPRELETC
jgi:hypothetical protein